MIKVSVVLPVYNVAEYLYHSLSCLANQTLKEIEIICVDDGSTDSSVTILQEFANKDSRFKVILNKHSFAGGARNAGLLAASGEYIMFLDPDDYYDVTMLESLYTKITEDKTDMLICGIYMVHENHIQYCLPSYKWYINDFYNNKIFTVDDIKDDIWFFMVYPYNKIYRRDFIIKNQIKFQEISNTNDASFAFETFIAADKISMTNERYYYYRAFRPGNTRLTKGKNLNCVIEAYEHSYKVCSKYPNFEKVKDGFNTIIISSLIHHLCNYCGEEDPNKAFYYNYVQEYLKNNFYNNKTVQNLLKDFNCYQYMAAFVILNNSYKKYVKIANNKGYLLKRQIGPFDTTLKFLNIKLYDHFYNIRKEKYQIFGLDILKYKFNDNTLSKYILGIKVSQKEKIKPEIENYFRYIKNRLNPDCKFVYIINEHLGETFLLSTMIEQLFHKDNIQKATFVVQSEAQKEVLNLFVDKNKIESVIVLSTSRNIRINSSLFIEDTKQVDDITYRVLLPETFWRFSEVGEKHYLERICENLDLDPNKMLVKANISSAVEADTISLARENGLNLNDFIYLSPEAISVQEIPYEFWENLVIRLQGLGYDIYLNSCNGKYCFKDVKTFKTTVSQTYVLAQKSKFIISMRSGLFEIIASAKKVPAICLYNGDNRITRNSIKNMKMLDYDKLVEFDYDTDSEILNKILANIKKDENINV